MSCCKVRSLSAGCCFLGMGFSSGLLGLVINVICSDIPACEISITACIKKYDNWPIVVEKNKFELEEGDAVLYAGCKQSHFRPGKYKGKGMAQVFFHYVDKNGPFTHHAYDEYNKTTGERYTEKDNEIKIKLKEEYDKRR